MRPLSIFAWFGYELKLEDSFRRIRAAGFDEVFLWWGEFEGDIPLREQPETARRLGLRVENAHAPFEGCNDLWLPKAPGERYAARLIDCIRGCAETGVPVLVVHLPDLANPPPCSPCGLERLKPVIEEAERRKVTLAFENLRHAPHLRAVLDTFGSPRVGYCYDSGHHHGWCREEPFLERYGRRLAALHLHDNNGVRDLHHLPFDGDIDWEGLVARLRQTGYAGSVALEVQAFTGYEERMTADAYLARAYRAAAKVRELLDGPSKE